MRLEDRLQKFIQVNPLTGCWDWTGAATKPRTEVRETQASRHRAAIGSEKVETYTTEIKAIRPLIWFQGRMHNARRLMVSPHLDPGIQVKTHCGNDLCVNPAHLRLVYTHNTRTGERAVLSDVQFIVDTFPDNPDEALKYGATDLHVREARRILLDHAKQDRRRAKSDR